jgi:hypothetical protein
MLRAMTVVFVAAALLCAGAGSPPEPEVSNPAMNAPDMVAWQLFLEVNADAKTASNNNALFETWASDCDTFQLKPAWPGQGQAGCFRAPILPAIVGGSLKAESAAAAPIRIQVVPSNQGDGGAEEVRRNRASFDFIVQNDLYKVSGLQKSFDRQITFPTDAVEVKANWYPVFDAKDPTKSAIPGYGGDPNDAAKTYHVNRASDGKLYALVSMHIISKLVPNWTWATFEHANNPGRCDYLGCADSFGAKQARVAPHDELGRSYGPCAKSPQLLALFAAAKMDPAYANYCLKGSQIDFTDQSGEAVRLGNSVTERGFVQQSSCMSCHGRAAFNQNGFLTSLAGFDSHSPSFDGDGDAPIGPIRQEWFWNAGATKDDRNPPLGPLHAGQGASPPPQRWAREVDFVWSVPFCAINDTTQPDPRPKPNFCGKK